jgi:hypothetical protein
MEVHHHSHTAAGGAGKKWTHYFWEFFMLFLAVTLGFFVENQREHFVEHLREKQYAKSFYDDFKVDLGNINRTYDEKMWVKGKLDSLNQILNSGINAENNELVYYYERFLTKKDIFTSQDITFKQLMSSGNLRYFDNPGLYKKIAYYYNLYERYHQLTENEFGNASELSEMESVLFNAGDLNSLYNRNAETFYNIFKRPEKKFQPVTPDKYQLNFLQVKTGNANFASNASALFLNWLKIFATEIIADFEKEYHLK